MLILETERLIIRDHVKQDLLPMNSWLSDNEVMHYLNWKSRTLTDTKIKLKECLRENKSKTRKKYFFAVELKNPSQYIGDCGLTILTKNESGGIADIGYFLLKQFWGRGYAVECAKELIRFGLHELHLHKITAGCHADNRQSEKVMIKSGMVKEACLKKQQYHSGQWYNRVIYTVLK